VSGRERNEMASAKDFITICFSCGAYFEAQSEDANADDFLCPICIELPPDEVA
jgi:predicted RNA-binding Zn-ribbon protein involved in translation (DUF1610 family)